MASVLKAEHIQIETRKVFLAMCFPLTKILLATALLVGADYRLAYQKDRDLDETHTGWDK